MLHQNGIGGILDYAAEDDMPDDEGPGGSSSARESGPGDQVVARTFDYGSEKICDGHMETFMKSIEAAAEAPGRGFAAIKVWKLPITVNLWALCRISQGSGLFSGVSALL